MKKLVILSFIFATLVKDAASQGCVAIRNLAGFGQFAHLGFAQTSDQWMLDINNRYFEAWQFLQGKTDITPTDPNNSGNIYEYTMNIGLSRLLKHGWSIALDMPISSNTVVSRGEHASGYRHATHAYGLGDIRFTVYKWLLYTETYQRGNIQFGFGIKFPTGNYHTEDYFYNDSTDPSAKVLAPVNPAIQLGDGGTGITVELNGYYIFSKAISVYGNFFYLINPKDQNGVATWPPNCIPADYLALQHQITADVNSVPDNYTMRGGASFTYNKWVGTAGLRFEGAPAHDLLGQNNGCRRVGYIFSVEPGVQYKLKKSFLYFFLGIPIDRASIETVPDQRSKQITGQYTITAGHFSKALVYIGYSFMFK